LLSRRDGELAKPLVGHVAVAGAERRQGMGRSSAAGAAQFVAEKPVFGCLSGSLPLRHAVFSVHLMATLAET